MAKVNGSILHYTDMKKFLKKSSSPKSQVNLKIVPFVTLFKNCLRNCDPSKDMAAVGEGGEAFCTVWTSEKFFSSETTCRILQ